MSEFDFNMDFGTVADRLVGERDKRRDLAARALSFNISFLDDCLRAILPHDLILVGAKTGSGKSQLVSIIAQANAIIGKRVHYFALEAEPLEVERRLKFRVLSNIVWQNRVYGRDRMNFADWYLGRCDDLTEVFEERAEREISERFATLTTYYRKKQFTLLDIDRLFASIEGKSDLIILDHLHYVDAPDENENVANKAIVKTIRDIALEIGIPVILVAHLRKQGRRQTLVPTLEDFHGSSDITKIATRAVVIAPARGDDVNVDPGTANTYMAVVKDRLSGETNTTAVIGYDIATGLYAGGYKIGQMDIVGENWFELVDERRRPRWARNAIAPPGADAGGGDDQ